MSANSPDQTQSPKGLVGDVVANLEALFRHILPGGLIIGAAYAAHPSWFRSADLHSWQGLLVATVVAITVGNAWFVINRFSVHQIVDYLDLTRFNGHLT